MNYKYLIENISKLWRGENKNTSESKLNEIDSKIKAIFEKFSLNGITTEEIASTGLRILKPSIYGSKIKKIFSLLIKLMAIIVVLFSLKSVEPFNRLTYMYGRLLLFQTGSFWDWNRWYTSSCLLNNPFYKMKSLRERDCYSCEDISRIERRDDINTEIIAEIYIRNQIPIIVGSEVMKRDVDNWPIGVHSFGLKDIKEIYGENDWKNVCMFRSNIKTNDHLTLLKRIISNKYPEMGWYAHWENCNKNTEKQLRKYYSRPKVVPQVLELTRANWIVVSHNYVGLTYKLIDPSPGTQVLLMIQLKGQNRIKLEPKEFCSSRDCRPTYDSLNANEMIVLSARLWNLSYCPTVGNNSDLNLAIIIGAVND